MTLFISLYRYLRIARAHFTPVLFQALDLTCEHLSESLLECMLCQFEVNLELWELVQLMFDHLPHFIPHEIHPATVLHNVIHKLLIKARRILHYSCNDLHILICSWNNWLIWLLFKELLPFGLAAVDNEELFVTGVDQLFLMLVCLVVWIVQEMQSSLEITRWRWLLKECPQIFHDIPLTIQPFLVVISKRPTLLKEPFRECSCIVAFSKISFGNRNLCLFGQTPFSFDRDYEGWFLSISAFKDLGIPPELWHWPRTLCHLYRIINHLLMLLMQLWNRWMMIFIGL